MSARNRLPAFLAAALLGMAAPAQAQVPADPTEGAMRLELGKAEPMGGGKVLLLEGQTLSGRPAKFSLDGLSVAQPIVVALLTRPALPGVQLSVQKPFVKGASKTASTDDAGQARISFRLQGDALIQVQASKAAQPYQLMVWVGPEVRLPMASPFKPAKPEALRQFSGDKKP